MISTMEESRRSLHLSLSPQQLKEGSIYLGQAFLGLAALAQIDSEDLAKTMEIMVTMVTQQSENSLSGSLNNLDFGMASSSIKSRIINADFSKLSDRLLSQSQGNPLGSPLTSPELVFSIQFLSYLCQQHQELIRRAVSLMEQMTKEGKDPWQISLLKDYNQRLIAFHSLYLAQLTGMEFHQWSGKILLDLLFYSSPYGQSRLWLRCTQPVDLI